MEVGKISEGIQATIDLLESIPVRMKDMDVTGYALYTAIKNLKIIKEATVKAENGESVENEIDVSVEEVKKEEVENDRNQAG